MLNNQIVAEEKSWCKVPAFEASIIAYDIHKDIVHGFPVF